MLYHSCLVEFKSEACIYLNPIVKFNILDRNFGANCFFLNKTVKWILIDACLADNISTSSLIVCLRGNLMDVVRQICRKPSFQNTAQTRTGKFKLRFKNEEYKLVIAVGVVV